MTFIFSCEHELAGELGDASPQAVSSSDCVIHIDEQGTADGDGSSWEQSVTSLEAALTLVDVELNTSRSCELRAKRNISDLDSFKDKLASYNGRVKLTENYLNEANASSDFSSGNSSLSYSANSSGSSSERNVRVLQSSNFDAQQSSDHLVSELEEMESTLIFSHDDYMPFANCSCDTFTGRVEMTATTDANKWENSGVLEIGNRLRLDNNEIITNTNSTLYLQNDNNGDLKVDSAGYTFMVDASANRVGIGTFTPGHKLHVEGGGIGASPDQNVTSFFGRAAIGYCGHSDYASFAHRDRNETNGYALLQSAAGNTYLNARNTFSIWFRINNSTKMILLSNGNFGIGTTTPDYKLDVHGTIRAESILVENFTADFVFDDDYYLMPLEDVEDYIIENGHLPEIPKAEHVEKFGSDLGETQTRLLQKIEELTLHLNAQNKQMKNQLNEIEKLKKSMNLCVHSN